ncbi:RNA polymerase ECF family sigma subunit [Chitinophaga niastensis]|uniref:RNA polymerase ECF family sigma subunit n=1 Tax=Chitinophaga niastensis TaxID=536980 RepID=A0A2P8HUN3_CHINA|nr:RNA polymerase sigma factor [Chitinophaga niastensis]PSL49895.1 RNA polymerase ECF family sigma subunit [Chitinophaga niastensis]
MEKAILSDNELVKNSINGNKDHLGMLIERYNNYIFNVCYKMLWNVNDARDLTQEILIAIITKLDTFKFNSSFKTWTYRIATNHTLNFIKSSRRHKLFSFEEYGNNLDKTPDFILPEEAYNNIDNEILFEEVKQTCMTGMLMCLDEQYRMVFIIGEILGFNDKIGCEILAITPENFRMMLSRAKKDLYNFMNDKCGLINKNNSCRCSKKTKSFIKAGYVNPEKLLFYPKYKIFIEEAAAKKQEEMEDHFYADYRELFQKLTFLSNKAFSEELDQILTSPKVKALFNLN